MVGSAVLRALNKSASYRCRIITASRIDVDLTNPIMVHEFFGDNNISEVYLAAAKVGGIIANRDNPVGFLQENLEIQSNVIKSSYKTGVKRLLFSDPVAFTPNMPPNQCKKMNCLLAALSQRTRLMRLRKLLVLNFVRVIIGSTAKQKEWTTDA